MIAVPESLGPDPTIRGSKDDNKGPWGVAASVGHELNTVSTLGRRALTDHPESILRNFLD